MNMLKRRIDIHSHYFPPAYKELLRRHGMDVLDGVKAPEWSLERQFEYMDRLNISFAALSISSPHLHLGDRAEAVETARACNEYGSALAESYPDRFAALASLPLPEIGGSMEEIRYCREKLNIRGFALLSNYGGEYLGSAKFEPVMEELNRYPTLITIHPTVPHVSGAENAAPELPAPVMEYFFETTRTVADMLLHGTVRKYPNLRFVVPHGGAFITILSDRLIPLAGMLLPDRDLDIAGDLRRLYYDLAGFSMPKQFGLLRTITDGSHLLYGSDSPFTALPMCVKLAEQMDAKLGELSEQVYEKNPSSLLTECGIMQAG